MLANIINAMIEDGDYPGEPEITAQTPNPSDYSFEYQLLDRLRSDCEYFLGNGNRAEKHLWAESVDGQIAKMRELYQLLPEKPEWLTEQEIDSYEQRMTTAPEIPPAELDEQTADTVLSIVSEYAVAPDEVSQEEAHNLFLEFSPLFVSKDSV